LAVAARGGGVVEVSRRLENGVVEHIVVVQVLPAVARGAETVCEQLADMR